MKPHSIALLSLSFILPLLATGCSESASMQRQLERLENSINSMRSIQASHTSDIDTLQAEVRNLTGRLDETQHFQEQRIGQEVSGLRNDISSLKSRVPPPAIIPVAALETDEPFLQTLNSSASRLVLDSLVFLREGKFGEADALLQNALEYGKQDLAHPYALFWSGVSADGRGDHKGALRSYNELAVLYPKHLRTPLGMIRQADVFVRLGDKNAASFALKKLIADYPKSGEASVAKSRLTELSRR